MHFILDLSLKSYLYFCHYRKPASRYEVLQLQETLQNMMDKAGINDEEVEVKGPTQVCLKPAQ